MIRFLQFLLLLPATILVWLFYILPLVVSGEIGLVAWYKRGFIMQFVVLHDETWYSRLWRDWYGWSGPCVMICRFLEPEARERTFLHELEHCKQQFRWGLLFYPAYIVSSIWILLFRRNKHSYYDNPFEVAARKAAGQRLDIPPSQWSGGSDDRWIWW